jgi:hypothetical protein
MDLKEYVYFPILSPSPCWELTGIQIHAIASWKLECAFLGGESIVLLLNMLLCGKIMRP